MNTDIHYYPHLDKPLRTGILKLDSVELKPTVKGGVPVINSLSERELEKLQAHSSYQRRVAAGALVVPDEAVPPPELPDYSALADLSGFNIEGDDNSVGAEDIVAQTTDIDLLNRWLQAESRKTLKAIIEDRMEALL